MSTDSNSFILLSQPLHQLRGISLDKAALLQTELGIYTIENLIFHFPHRYVDKSEIYTISQLQDDMPSCQIKGKLGVFQTVNSKSRISRMTAKFTDVTGVMDLVWFKNIRGVERAYTVGAEYIAFGNVKKFGRYFSIVHPEMEQVKSETFAAQSGQMSSVYSLTEKMRKRYVDSKAIGRMVNEALYAVANQIKEILPDALIHKYRLMDRQSAILQIHQPKDISYANDAKRRLKFEELFIIQLSLLVSKQLRQQSYAGHIFDKVGPHFVDFYENHLPFKLTNAQKRVLKEIRIDMRTGKQMNRLLQGDVGSGKTIVAILSMLLAVDNGKQAIMMAPTEILATQHFNSIFKYLQPLGLNVRKLTGSTKKSERNKLNEDLTMGTLHIMVGTHALLEDWVAFPDLGIAIIDEQHRFGVAQRARLWAKNVTPPHMLVMTATPIPRTLAMTLYGDLDTSVLDELPPGRKPIQTMHYFENFRLKTLQFMRDQIAEGRQVYVVYPLIEESEAMDYMNLNEGYDAILSEFPRPKYQISIVHGKQDATAKEAEMQRFKKGETQIMVSTTVIEVGVDVPNASVMIIESAERFGLSQLHQLRGRVGRGASQSFCILMTGYKLSAEAKIRLETMCRTNDGFELSEVDLQLRGPGDLAGTKQSGILELKLANLSQDQAILTAARESALEILNIDPELQLPEHKQLNKLVEKGKLNKDGLHWSIIS